MVQPCCADNRPRLVTRQRSFHVSGLGDVQGAMIGTDDIEPAHFAVSHQLTAKPAARSGNENGSRTLQQRRGLARWVRVVAAVPPPLPQPLKYRMCQIPRPHNLLGRSAY